MSVVQLSLLGELNIQSIPSEVELVTEKNGVKGHQGQGKPRFTQSVFHCDDRSDCRTLLRQYPECAARPGRHKTLEEDSTHRGVWKQSGKTEKIQKLKKDLL